MNGDPAGTGEAELRQAAREAIRSRVLPARRPHRIWGGPGTGTGEVCALCGNEVGKADVAFELEFDQGEGQLPRCTVQMHAQCFAAWELERDGAPASAEPRSVS